MSNIRRFCTSLMALVLTAGTFASYPMGNQTVKADTLAVSNDFETTYNGWVSTGNLVDVIAAQEGGYQSNRGLKVSNRQTKNDGISSEKGFYLDGGIEYNYSFMVKTLASSKDTIKVSLTYTYEDTKKVETVDLISKKVNANEWVELSTDYKAPQGTIGHTITITTDSTSDFYLDNVKITEKSAQNGNYTVSATSSEYGLKDVYSNNFKFGTCIPSMELQDSKAMALVLKEFNSITCENEMKPDATIDKSKSTNTNIAVSLSSCASILDFCVQNNIAVRGHTLVWHSQTPTWFFKENFDINGAWVSKEVMDMRMESYIKNMFEAIKTQYPTLNLYAYDVANECISDSAKYGNPSTYCRTAGANTGNGYSPWVQIYGDNSFVEKAFTYARKYAPSGCKLFYNDYNEYMGDKMLAIKDMVQDLYNKGVLDGIGMQSHLDTTWPSAEGYKAALDLYNTIGCEIQVTELDIATPNGDENAHAQRYKEIMQGILDTYNNGHNITAVCVWGTTDNYSWRDEDVLLFDDNYQAKKSYSEIFNLGTIPSNPNDSNNNNNNISSGNYYFYDTFDGTDFDWSARGNCTVGLSGRMPYSGTDALVISNRSAVWNGVQKSLNIETFKPGNEYSFSVLVNYLDSDVDTETFYLTLQYTDQNGNTKYENIDTKTVTKGEYTQLSNTNFKIPSGAKDIKLVVESATQAMNFYIDEVMGASAGTVYGTKYHFCDGFDSNDFDWSARGNCTVGLSGRMPYSGTDALVISNRSAVWNGVQKSLDAETFKPGNEYGFSVFVTYLDSDAETEKFYLTLQYTDQNGNTKYENIDTKTVTKGEYTQLSNTNFKIPSDAKDMKLVVESATQTMNFYIDEATAMSKNANTSNNGSSNTENNNNNNNTNNSTNDETIDLPVSSSIDVSKYTSQGITGLKLHFSSVSTGSGACQLKTASGDWISSTDYNLDNNNIATVDLSSYSNIGTIDIYTWWNSANATIDGIQLITKSSGTTNDNSNQTVDTSALASEFNNISLYHTYKNDDTSNVLMTQRFTADPGVMEYNGRVYVYSTNDIVEFDSNGNVANNSFSKITTLNCMSSDDLVNWTDHGTIQVSGSNGVAPWTTNSWAPTACHKTINGKEKFFLYFCNGANGIVVLESDSPTGPWSDPLGKPLITRQTANCQNVVWCFDPAVFVDDDGTGYLYFGGGIADGGDYAHPKTARVVKLGNDMTSLANTPQEIDAPYLFEDSCMTKINGKYYYSYCSNFNTSGNSYGLNSGAIQYMVSDNPMGPFTYTGQMFDGIYKFFGTGGNNHHTLITFNNQPYLFYHTQVLQDKAGLSGGYRNTQVDKVTINSNGTIQSVTGTLQGVSQLKTLNPYETVQAETMYNQGGINVRSVNNSGNTVITDVQRGDWISVNDVNFSKGSKSITVKASSTKDAVIKICTGSADGEAIGYVKVSNTNGQLKDFTTSVNNITGIKDLYFVFSDTLEFDSWSFN